ncbi:hypothetical protein XM38_047310 [Halomicronema hongdechloris C2206]|uniref:Glycosyl transferase family 1 domain-containing protein n=1 Tax=Halomicronema hongdechloris C2206 TaxID=1641165 RepID=A0A1Z3HTY9_9CYAN|nr:glycosyltransferase [Halomicronema hongdechloris]ASC73759.1 hypothetical protein XM38_047310 [Halomicronema hongdechloris C2206]
MRTLYFLLPGTYGRFACGGLWAELKTLNLAQQICTAAVVTYRQREKDTLFLEDVLARSELEDVIFVLSWGFDVPKLARQLRSHHTIYHAHSTGYGFRLPATVPIITVSRNTLGYWGQQSPQALLYYLPNLISHEFQNRHQPRDIDVLVQVRKSSEYLLKQLVPALQDQCNLVLLDGYVADLADLFNRSHLYLYDSAEYWAQARLTEGFGLPPLEAMACGCQVFSSVNSSLADYLDPGFNSYKIAGCSVDYDVARIRQALTSPTRLGLTETDLAPYRFQALVHRLEVILQDINHFFDGHYSLTIAPLTARRLLRLRWQRTLAKLQQRLQGL